MSRPTASTMITPTAICCQFELTPMTTRPLVTTCSSSTPTMPPASVPAPPKRLTPPTTTPAMTVSSQPEPIEVVPLARSAITNMPAMAASAPTRMKAPIL